MKIAGSTPLLRALRSDDQIFLPVLIGVTAYLAAIVLAAIYILSAPTERHEAANRLVVQLPVLKDAAANLQRLGVVASTLQALPGVAKVDLICERHLALPAWQQVRARSPEAASPLALLGAELRVEHADAVPALRHRLLTEFPDSTIISEDEFARVARRPFHVIQGLMVLILALLSAALCAGVAFTIGAHLKPTSETISLLHALGASDATLVRVIVDHTLLPALIGGASGAASAMITLLAFAGLAEADFAAAAAAIFQSPAIWGLIIMLPVATITLVALSAWFFARRALAALP
jgi:predicted lysophospholipase L1 biosynthesis ABC-type transport system permease subunit